MDSLEEANAAVDSLLRVIELKDERLETLREKSKLSLESARQSKKPQSLGRSFRNRQSCADC